MSGLKMHLCIGTVCKRKMFWEMPHSQFCILPLYEEKGLLCYVSSKLHFFFPSWHKHHDLFLTPNHYCGNIIQQFFHFLCVFSLSHPILLKFVKMWKFAEMCNDCTTCACDFVYNWARSSAQPDGLLWRKDQSLMFVKKCL